jgi:hypothetical protein
MILRWTDPAYGQNYLDDVEQIRFLSSWGWSDSPDARAMVEAAKNGTPVSHPVELRQTHSNQDCPDIPDYEAIYGVPLVWDLGNPTLWRPFQTSDQPPPVLAFIEVVYGDRDTEVWAIICIWMALLSGQGDTVDTLVNARSVARRATASAADGG